ncbi:MAG: type II secretion system F family protein [Lachnospiraceae bacterium]|nr:type II secretion system F family protein [Lachnospiraceae bacterium]
MKTYRYTGLSEGGAKVSGVVDALDEFAAVNQIKPTCPIITDIKEVKEVTGPFAFLFSDIGGKKLNQKSLSVMCNQFAIILSSGVPVDDAMRLVSTQTEDKVLKKILMRSAEDISHGSSVADAFVKNGANLPQLFIETIRAGEISGTLVHSFQTMAEYYEKAYKMRQKIKTTMTYPIFVLIIAVVVLIVVIGFVMPTFTRIFESLNADLPMQTVILINISHFFAKWWWVIAAVIVGLLLVLHFWKKSDAGKEKWAVFLLHAPGIGKINNLQACTEFSTTMSALLSSGMSVADSLEITSKCMTNEYHKRNVFSMVELIRTGHTLGEVMKTKGYFPDVLNEMTSVGEETGELSKTLKVIGDYYSNEYDYATKQALARLEPALLVFLALFAGYIVISLYLPMFTMYNNM